MFRTAGIAFRRRNLLIITLTRIFGIGKSHPNAIIKQAKISSQERRRDLDPARIQILRFYVKRKG